MKTTALFLLPIILLAGVIALFLGTDGAGLGAPPAAPVEDLRFERTSLSPGLIELEVRNTGHGSFSPSFVTIRDMVLPFTLVPEGPIQRLGRATLRIPYPWVEAEAYEIGVFSSNSIAFASTIDTATATKPLALPTLAGLGLIGVYVGIIPVFLGIFWLPALRRLGPKAFTWLMALTVGLLLFLGIDAIVEALDGAGGLGAPFQGQGLIGLGFGLAFLSLVGISRSKSRLVLDEGGRERRVALMISAGIGLHNLGEGLAIGAAFSLGAADLGKFFVIGFIIQNITEGLGIIAPIIRQKPGLGFLAGLGILGGGPALAGALLGGLSPSPAFSVFALALGAGAVFEVAWEIGKMIGRKIDTSPIIVSSGVISGMALLYVTGLLVK